MAILKKKHIWGRLCRESREPFEINKTTKRQSHAITQPIIYGIYGRYCDRLADSPSHDPLLTSLSRRWDFGGHSWLRLMFKFSDDLITYMHTDCEIFLPCLHVFVDRFCKTMCNDNVKTMIMWKHTERDFKVCSRPSLPDAGLVSKELILTKTFSNQQRADSIGWSNW